MGYLCDCEKEYLKLSTKFTFAAQWKSYTLYDFYAEYFFPYNK